MYSSRLPVCCAWCVLPLSVFCERHVPLKCRRQHGVDGITAIRICCCSNVQISRAGSSEQQLVVGESRRLGLLCVIVCRRTWLYNRACRLTPNCGHHILAVSGRSSQASRASARPAGAKTELLTLQTEFHGAVSGSSPTRAPLDFRLATCKSNQAIH